MVNSSNLFNNGSNLGIGTSGPTEKLDVTGNVKASGTLTAGTVTYPNTHGTANQVLSTTGTGLLTWTTPSNGVPYTGATKGVDLGAYNLKVNGLTIGRGAGFGDNTAIGYEAFSTNITSSGNSAFGYRSLYSNTTGTDNTAFGYRSLFSNTTGFENTALGNFALANNTTGHRNTATGTGALQHNTEGSFNTANGKNALHTNTTGLNNTANGSNALYNNTTGLSNTAIGLNALHTNTTGSNNTAIGLNALYTNTTGSNNTAIGNEANVATAALTNATAIGNGAIVAESNTIQLGNTAVFNVKTSGTITAGAVTYPKTHGTANQVLSTTGSGTLVWTTPATSSGTSSAHYIGEAYGGGIVFYVTSDGLHGLIAETQDQSSTSSNWNEAQDIISNSSSHSAAGRLFTDWRLPTKHELNLMFTNIGQGAPPPNTNIGGFVGSAYWSSTKITYINGSYYAYNNAWYQNFGNGGMHNWGDVENTSYVRAIRAF